MILDSIKPEEFRLDNSYRYMTSVFHFRSDLALVSIEDSRRSQILILPFTPSSHTVLSRFLSLIVQSRDLVDLTGHLALSSFSGRSRSVVSIGLIKNSQNYIILGINWDN